MLIADMSATDMYVLQYNIINNNNNNIIIILQYYQCCVVIPLVWIISEIIKTRAWLTKPTVTQNRWCGITVGSG